MKIWLTALTLLWSSAAFADHVGYPLAAFEPVVWPVSLSMEEAASRVRDASGGRILSAEEVFRNGKRFYRVKVLTKRGVVRVVFVDAETGEFRLRRRR